MSGNKACKKTLCLELKKTACIIINNNKKKGTHAKKKKRGEDLEEIMPVSSKQKVDISKT